MTELLWNAIFNGWNYHLGVECVIYSSIIRPFRLGKNSSQRFMDPSIIYFFASLAGMRHLKLGRMQWWYSESILGSAPL